MRSLAAIFLVLVFALAAAIAAQQKINKAQADHIYIVRLKDGTRCAVLSSGGIDCDWKREENIQL